MLKKEVQSIEYQYIRGILGNDQQVLKKIYQDHLPGIIAMVKKNNGSIEDAKDIFQEAILIVYDKARQPGFELKGTFYSFLFGVSRFLWLRQLKKKYRKNITIDGDEGYIDEGEVNALQEKEEKWKLFHEVFVRLGEDCQKVLQYFFDGMSLKDIGEKMGYSVSYVKLKKFKCKEQFSEWMKNDRRYLELRN